MALFVGGCGIGGSETTGSATGAVTSAPSTVTATVPSSDDEIRVTLVPVGDSGITGTATFESVEEGGTLVQVDLDGDQAESREMHIHTGGCDKLDGRISLPLGDSADGTWGGLLEVELSQLTGPAPMAVTVHAPGGLGARHVACGELPLEGTSGELIARLEELDGSEVQGVATLVPAGQRTTVVIELEGDDGETRPAHIHEGTCESSRAEPSFPLTDVIEGRSETVIDVSVGELMSTDYIVNMHESPEALTVYVACGMLEPAA